MNEEYKILTRNVIKLQLKAKTILKGAVSPENTNDVIHYVWQSFTWRIAGVTQLIGTTPESLTWVILTNNLFCPLGRRTLWKIVHWVVMLSKVDPTQQSNMAGRWRVHRHAMVHHVDPRLYTLWQMVSEESPRWRKKGSRSFLSLLFGIWMQSPPG